jgi:hypothetical protein
VGQTPPPFRATPRARCRAPILVCPRGRGGPNAAPLPGNPSGSVSGLRVCSALVLWVGETPPPSRERPRARCRVWGERLVALPPTRTEQRWEWPSKVRSGIAVLPACASSDTRSDVGARESSPNRRGSRKLPASSATIRGAHIASLISSRPFHPLPGRDVELQLRHLMAIGTKRSADRGDPPPCERPRTWMGSRPSTRYPVLIRVEGPRRCVPNGTHHRGLQRPT